MNKINNISFTARRPEIRHLDHIMRHANQQYPRISPTYIEDNYISIKSGNQKCKTILGSLQEKLCIERFQNEHKYDPYQITSFDIAREKGLGNCGEASRIMLGALLSNGYKNSKPSEVIVNVAISDAKGNILGNAHIPYDHNVVLTEVPTKNKGKDRTLQVIVDGWLGKVMTLQEASTEYLSSLSDKSIKEIIQQAKKDLSRSIGNHTDCEYTFKIDYNNSGFWSKWDIEKYTEIVKEKYKDLTL